MRNAACVLVLVLGAGSAFGQTSYELDAQRGLTRVAEPEGNPDKALMGEVRRLIAQEQFSKAYEKVNAWIVENETSDSPELPDAFVLRGTAQMGMGREFRALFDFEKVAKRYPESEAFTKALERELDVANLYLNGLRKKVWGFRMESMVDVAEEIVVRINERLPGSKLAEKALMDLSDYYYRSRDLKMAATAYECFVLLFPRSELRQKAMERRIYATIAQFKGPKYDASGLVEAKYQVENYQQQYPREAAASGVGDALAARLDESAAAQMLEVSKWYMKRGDEASARLTLTRLVHRHPATAAAAEGFETLQAKGWVKTEEAAKAEEIKPRGVAIDVGEVSK